MKRAGCDTPLLARESRDTVEDIQRVYRPPQARSSHALQVNLYALMIEKNAYKLANILNALPSDKFADAQVVYFGEKEPVRCAVKLDRTATTNFLKVALAELIQLDPPRCFPILMSYGVATTVLCVRFANRSTAVRLVRHLLRTRVICPFPLLGRSIPGEFHLFRQAQYKCFAYLGMSGFDPQRNNLLLGFQAQANSG